LGNCATIEVSKKLILKERTIESYYYGANVISATSDDDALTAYSEPPYAIDNDAPDGSG
jgi:hypothetical protein